VKAKETRPSVEQRVTVQVEQAKELARALRSIGRSNHPRERALRTMELVVEHFRELGQSDDPPILDRDVLAPILEIQEGLIELERGVRVPLFEPAQRQGRPLSSFARMEQQELAALAVDAMRLAGYRLEKAARVVARKLEEVGYEFSPKTEPWRAVIGMRNEVTKRAKKRPTVGNPFGGFYAAQLEWIKRAVAERGKDPRQLARHYLDRLGKTA
jgi:hypothetical protein